MPRPGVGFNNLDGKLGKVRAVADGIGMLVISGVAVSGKIALAQPKQIFSLRGAEALGITAAYDTTNTTDAHEQIAGFYDEAPTGTELWIMVVAKTVLVEDICDKDLDLARKLVLATKGTGCILGVSRTPDSGYTPGTYVGVDPDIMDAITNAHELAKEFASSPQLQAPFRVILGGRDWKGTIGDLEDLNARTDDRVMVTVDGLKSGSKAAAVGRALGKACSFGSAIQRNIGRVKSGKLKITKAYFTNGNEVESLEDGWDALYDKNYLFCVTYPRVAGYFFVDDRMACSSGSDYCSLGRGRVIDKAQRLAHDYLVIEVNDDVEIETGTGYLPYPLVKEMESGTVSYVSKGLGEAASGVLCTIEAEQDIISSDNLAAGLSLIPKGYKKRISVDLGYTNPFSTN